MADEGPIVDKDADTEVLDEEPRSILLGLISQLRKGMDLHRVTLPTFILEPRSMLERFTDFMSHPELLLEAAREVDAEKRFINLLRYYLSGWHIRPKGVKKPYNPVLGEFFRCQWKFQDGSEAFYIAEQVSHHPPISVYYYASPENKVSISGEFRPKSKFLGNSAATIMNGGSTVRFLDYPKEEYTVTNPNVYVKGLLFGTMLLELGDTATLACEANDLVCDMEFTTKGFFSGAYNGIRGKVKRISTGEVLYNLSGKWTDVIYIQRNKKGAPLDVFFDANTSSITPKGVYAEQQQDEYESRRLWSKLTAALMSRDMDLASEAKTAVEDSQRKLRVENEEQADPLKSKFFYCEDDIWKFQHEAELDKLNPSDCKKRLLELIFPATKKD